MPESAASKPWIKLVSCRDTFRPTATLADLGIDDPRVDGGLRHFAFVVEDTDRGLLQTMTAAELKKLKIPGKTAIPSGIYEMGVRKSPKYNGADMLYLKDVPGFTPDTILIHPGNNDDDTEGCQPPGLYRDVATMTVSQSNDAVNYLKKTYMADLKAGRIRVTYEIRRAPPCIVGI